MKNNETIIKIQFENFTKMKENENSENDYENLNEYMKVFENTEMTVILNDYMKEQFKFSKQHLKDFESYDEINEYIEFQNFKNEKKYGKDYKFYSIPKKFYYDFLGNIENVIFEICKNLYDEITYKKHRQILHNILLCMNENFDDDNRINNKSFIVENVINGFDFYFKNDNKYFKGVEIVENDFKNHFDNIKLILRNIFKDLRKIIKENEIKNIKLELN